MIVSIRFRAFECTLTIQTDFGNVSHRMLDSPDDGIHEQLELWWGQLEQCGKAGRIDGTHHFEETDSMLGVFRKVLVDHVQGGFEDGVQNRADLRRQQWLRRRMSNNRSEGTDLLTPRTPMIVAIKFKTSASLAAGTLRW